MLPMPMNATRVISAVPLQRVVIVPIEPEKSTSGKALRLQPFDLSVDPCLTCGPLCLPKPAYLDTKDDVQRAAQLEQLIATPRIASVENPSRAPAPECLEQDLATIFGKELVGKPVDSIKEQADELVHRVSLVKSNLRNRIPQAKAWTLPHVPANRVFKDLVGGVNDTIDKVNVVPPTIRSGMITLADKVADTLR